MADHESNAHESSPVDFVPDFLDIAHGGSEAFHHLVPPIWGPVGMYNGAKEMDHAWDQGDPVGVLQGNATLGAGLAGTGQMFASLFGAQPLALALGEAGPLAASLAMGLATGTSLNNNSAKTNQFGGHRKASDDAAETGDMARQVLRDTGGGEPLAQIGGGVATLGMSVLNTADTLLDAVVMPPGLRDVMAQTGNGGIAGTGISLTDLVPGGQLLHARGREEVVANAGPNMTDLYSWIGRGGNPADSPFKGMY